MASSLRASLSTVTVSVAVFPKRKQNFMHTHFSLSWSISVFKNIARHTFKHLKQMPEKMTQSAEHVTWQTSSEYCRFAVPSGRTPNYVSFGCKIQILEIFLSPPHISHPFEILSFVSYLMACVKPPCSRVRYIFSLFCMKWTCSEEVVFICLFVCFIYRTIEQI